MQLLLRGCRKHPLIAIVILLLIFSIATLQAMFPELGKALIVLMMLIFVLSISIAQPRWRAVALIAAILCWLLWFLLGVL